MFNEQLQDLADNIVAGGTGVVAAEFALQPTAGGNGNGNRPSASSSRRRQSVANYPASEPLLGFEEGAMATQSGLAGNRGYSAGQRSRSPRSSRPRQAPEARAEDYPGQQMIGNNGREWRSQQDKNSKWSWRQVGGTAQPGTQYWTTSG